MRLESGNEDEKKHLPWAALWDPHFYVSLYRLGSPHLYWGERKPGSEQQDVWSCSEGDAAHSTVSWWSAFLWGIQIFPKCLCHIYKAMIYILCIYADHASASHIQTQAHIQHTCIWVYMYIFTHQNIHIHVYTHIHTNTWENIQQLIYSHIRIYTMMYKHTHAHYKHTHKHTLLSWYSNTPTYVHTLILHTHLHTFIYTSIQ